MWELDDRTGKFCLVDTNNGNPRHRCALDINYVRARRLRDAKQAANQHLRNLEGNNQ
jgi:hypothetical protein